MQSIIATFVLYCVLLTTSVVVAAETFVDATVRGLVEAMLANLPPDIDLSYDNLATDVKNRTVGISGLRVTRRQPEIDSLGTLVDLRISGINILIALSGQPFTAEHVELSKLHVTEHVHREGKPEKRVSWSINKAILDGVSVPSLAVLAQKNSRPEDALARITFRKGRMNGRSVRTVEDIIKQLRAK